MLIKTNFTLTDPADAVPFVTDWETAIPALTGLLAWCPARLSGVVKDGSDKVSQLIDLSGNGNHFTQNTAADQPLWQAEQINGHGALAFEASTVEWMLWGGTMPTNADFTKVVLFKNQSADGTTRHLLGNTGTHKNTLYANPSNGVTHSVGSSGTNADAVVSDQGLDWTLAIASFDDSAETAKLSIDGGSPVTATTAGSSTTQSSLYMGVSNATLNSPYDGQIALVMVFNIDLLDAANSEVLSSVKSYVSDAFGLSLS